MNQIQRVMQIITAKDKMGQKVNRIYFPKDPNAQYDFDKIKNQYAEPRSKEEAEEQKKLKLALSVDDIANRVDVDSTDDKKRKNKGHDRAAELSLFLQDVADEIRDGKTLTKDKLQLAGYLMKLSKTATEGEEVKKQNVEEQFDSMLAEAFDKFRNGFDMIITIAGEQEFIKTTETTVSDAKRVYISWAKESVTTENKYVEHKELTDKSKPHDEYKSICVYR